MENFENNEHHHEPVPQEQEIPVQQEVPAREEIPVQQETAPVQEEIPAQPEQKAEPVTPVPESSPYSNAGVGRKESPFADSPYVMNHQQEAPAYRQPNPNAYRCGSTYIPPIPPQQPPVKPKKAKKEKKGGKVWKTILCAVLALAVVAGGCGITAMLVNNRWEAEMNTMQQNLWDLNAQLGVMQNQIDAAAKAAEEAAKGNSASGNVSVGVNLTPSEVYAMNYRSVVLISCEVMSNSFGQSVTGTSTGSGFVLTENGYVVTNAHVVEGATSIEVSIPTGEDYTAKLVGSDTINDVALLKVEATDLKPVIIGSSTDLIVGDQVVAIGNPLGDLTSTMTVGYVSAKDRDVTTDGVTINMIQTDAAINSGNSGGPLFNMKGEVVGITTAKYSGSSSSGASIESIGFAIPIDDVIGMLNDLRDYGYVTGAYLGVMVSDMDSQTAAYYRLPVGAYVQEVTPGYCAEKAGLQAGDIIIGLGEYEVGNISELTRALRKFKAGDTTVITVFRSGAELELSITLDEKPASTETAPSQPGNGQMPDNGSYEEWYDYFFGDKG